MKFTKIPETAFQEIQLNAGVLLKSFEPTTGAIELTNILGATTGGFKFADTVTYMDFGEDIDNCPKNSKELKKIDTHEVKASGTYVTVNAALVQSLIGAADVADTKITPRNDLKDEDFVDLWWVGDYSDKNGETNGGYIAIHMMNTLSTGGFQIQTGDKTKGQFAFEYTAHYSMEAQDTVPYEVYVKAGTEETVE
jgi:hypothetical protein